LSICFTWIVPKTSLQKTKNHYGVWLKVKQSETI